MKVPLLRRSRRWRWLLAVGSFLLALAAAWIVFSAGQASGRHSRDSKLLNKSLADLRAQPPWHCRLPPSIRWFLPKVWQSEAFQVEFTRDQKRWEAVGQFGQLGTNAWPAVPALLRALDHRNPEIGAAAAVALARMQADECPEWDRLKPRLRGLERAARALRYLVVGRDPFGRRFDLLHRRFGLLGLDATGPTAAVAYPDVLDMVESTEPPELRAAAVLALAPVERARTNTVPLFKALLRDTNEWPTVGAAAAAALVRSAPRDPETTRLLREALRDPRSAVRLAAAKSLWKLSRSPEEVLPVLTTLLSHKLVSIRVGALGAIAELGAAARSSRAEVKRLASDENAAVRQAAAIALRSLDGRPLGRPD